MGQEEEAEECFGQQFSGGGERYLKRGVERERERKRRFGFAFENYLEKGS
jgi:hypothetical protein